MTQVELWCTTSFKCALVEKDRPVSRLIWGWRNPKRCAELKWKGVDSACKMVYYDHRINWTGWLVTWRLMCISLNNWPEKNEDFPFLHHHIVSFRIQLWCIRESFICTLLILSGRPETAHCNARELDIPIKGTDHAVCLMAVWNKPCEPYGPLGNEHMSMCLVQVYCGVWQSWIAYASRFDYITSMCLMLLHMRTATSILSTW